MDYYCYCTTVKGLGRTPDLTVWTEDIRVLTQDMTWDLRIKTLDLQSNELVPPLEKRRCSFCKLHFLFPLLFVFHSVHQVPDFQLKLFVLTEGLFTQMQTCSACSSQQLARQQRLTPVIMVLMWW